jgi:DNA (cytosine-5)-methyltransferase 1
MRFGSVCSGIEAASVAWHPLGWKAAWLSEIEPFPSAVLKHHYPDVPNLGDMTTLPERILSGEIEAPDVFCGGTPCQAFSVAGLRKSLEDARGNLSLTFVGIANAIDHVRSVRSAPPAIVFWENVPGVLSTSDNAFGCFLGALAGEDEPIIPSGGKWTNAGCVFGPQRAVAWRVLDAQYFGVAQRRRRVFVVASARDNFNPAEILFEFDGVRRDTAPSREARKEVTECAGTLTANGGGLNRPAGNANELDFCVTVDGYRSSSIGGYSEGCGTLRANGGDLGGGSETLVSQPTYAIQGSMIGRNDNAGPQGDGINEEVCFTQNCVERHAVAQPIAWDEELNPSVDVAGTLLRGGAGGRHDGVAQPMPINTMVALRHEALGEGTGFGIGDAGDPAYTLTKGHSHAVAQPIAFQQTADCLTAAYGTKWNGNASATNGSLFAAQSMAVRRLTPIECERLQGFPDNYTNIPWRNKPESPDGPRYKALGNSWAVPVVAWIGQRISEAVK